MFVLKSKCEKLEEDLSQMKASRDMYKKSYEELLDVTEAERIANEKKVAETEFHNIKFGKKQVIDGYVFTPQKQNLVCETKTKKLFKTKKDRFVLFEIKAIEQGGHSIYFGRGRSEYIEKETCGYVLKRSVINKDKAISKFPGVGIRGIL
jgi:hypothetical protein